MLHELLGDFDGNCQFSCEPLRQPLCGYSWTLRGLFLANCSDSSRQLPGKYLDVAWDTGGMLRGLLRGLHLQLPSHLRTVAPTTMPTFVGVE